MTPEELAREALYGFSAFTGGTLQAIEGAIRSALAERDAQWLAAVRPGDDGETDDGWLWCGNCDRPLDARTPTDVRECCACSWSATLRALLDAAARSEEKEKSDG